MSDKSKFYYLFTNEELSIINIFWNCIIECLETRKLKQGLWYWSICSLSVYIINNFFKALNPTRNLVFIIYNFIYICIIASNDNNQCMQFVCPYCGLIDWNNKYSYSYSYSVIYQSIQSKPPHAVTCIKRSPFSCPIIENFIWIESLLRGHLSYKAIFLCPKGDLLMYNRVPWDKKTETGFMILKYFFSFCLYFYFKAQETLYLYIYMHNCLQWQ